MIAFSEQRITQCLLVDMILFIHRKKMNSRQNRPRVLDITYVYILCPWEYFWQRPFGHRSTECTSPFPAWNSVHTRVQEINEGYKDIYISHRHTLV